MARGDRRGPEGRGPMTGRGAGYCAGNSVPGYMERAPRGGMGRGCRGTGKGGRTMGMGRGFGQGRNGGYYYYGSAPAPVDEREMLKSEAEEMKRSLDIISARLKELDKEDNKA